MALRIVSADERLAEPRGIKACIFGKSGIGKAAAGGTGGGPLHRLHAAGSAGRIGKSKSASDKPSVIAGDDRRVPEGLSHKVGLVMGSDGKVGAVAVAARTAYCGPVWGASGPPRPRRWIRR